MIWSILLSVAAAAPADTYRRWSILGVDDRHEQTLPKYQDRRAKFTELTLWLGEECFLRAKYVVPRGDQMIAFDTGVRTATVQSIEEHELLQRRRRHQEVRAAVMANADLVDPREPEFAGRGRVCRVQSLERNAHVQIAVAILDHYWEAPPPKTAVELHLIHDEYPSPGRPGVIARKFSSGLARVTALGADDAAMIAQLQMLSGLNCERTLRN